jgi:hypothetical protein
MMTFSLDSTEFYRKAASSLAAIHQDMERGVQKAIAHGAAEAKTGGWKDRTGNLRLSIVSRPIGWKAQTYWGQFNTGVAYAACVEYETKPHMIYPKASYGTPVAELWPNQSRRGRGKGQHEHTVGRGIALRWKDASGENIFARSVFHPGTMGFHFMRDASTSTRSYLINELHGNFPALRSLWIH